MKKLLVSEKQLSEINFERLKNALVYIKNNLIESDNKIICWFIERHKRHNNWFE